MFDETFQISSGLKCYLMVMLARKESGKKDEREAKLPTDLSV